MPTPVALSIAGSDPSGGAGIQADLKTFHQFGVFGQAAVTLITVQNSTGVEHVEILDAQLVERQILAVIEDIRPHAAKTGALGSAAIVQTLARLAAGFDFPLVVDPVRSSKHGAQLSPDISPLIPRAFLITPNLDEAAAHDLDSMRAAARRFADLGAKNVLVKGGHLPGDAVDLLLTENGAFHEFRAPRIPTPHTHGTGCALSAAIAAELAKQTPLVEAVRRAKAFVTEAIRTNPGLGAGSGPLNFFAR
ncbi:MAG TPA: bifunctional hydroxymethylpyrimidine kinase/phosphomethylpyrimidine kinase [Bryobacteraceae bacterium]|nr:bifunctional hydroxymethylpyrimidine kinase/phosphomethylpyrimidine kinase [Bryobacteraceae bacterium]